MTLDEIEQYKAYLEKLAQSAEDEAANIPDHFSKAIFLAKAVGIHWALKVLEDGSYKWDQKD